MVDLNPVQGTNGKLNNSSFWEASIAALEKLAEEYNLSLNLIKLKTFAQDQINKLIRQIRQLKGNHDQIRALLATFGLIPLPPEIQEDPSAAEPITPPQPAEKTPEAPYKSSAALNDAEAVKRMLVLGNLKDVSIKDKDKVLIEVKGKIYDLKEIDQKELKELKAAGLDLSAALIDLIDRGANTNNATNKVITIEEIKALLEAVEWYAKTHHLDDGDASKALKIAAEIYNKVPGFRMVGKSAYEHTVGGLRKGSFKAFLAGENKTVKAFLACLEDEMINEAVVAYIKFKILTADYTLDKKLSEDQINELLDILACLPVISKLPAELSKEYFGFSISRTYEGEFTAEKNIAWLGGKEVEEEEEEDKIDGKRFAEKYNKLVKEFEANFEKKNFPQAFTAFTKMLALLRKNKPSNPQWDAKYNRLINNTILNENRDAFLAKLSKDPNVSAALANELEKALKDAALLKEISTTDQAERRLSATLFTAKLKKTAGAEQDEIEEFINISTAEIWKSNVWKGNEESKIARILEIAKLKKASEVSAKDIHNFIDKNIANDTWESDSWKGKEEKKLLLALKIVEFKKAAKEKPKDIQTFLNNAASEIWDAEVWKDKEGEKALRAIGLAQAKANLFISKEKDNSFKMQDGVKIDAELKIIAEGWNKNVKLEKAEKPLDLIVKAGMSILTGQKSLTSAQAANLYVFYQLIKNDEISKDSDIKKTFNKAINPLYEKTFSPSTSNNSPAEAQATRRKPKKKAVAVKNLVKEFNNSETSKERKIAIVDILFDKLYIWKDKCINLTLGKKAITFGILRAKSKKIAKAMLGLS